MPLRPRRTLIVCSDNPAVLDPMATAAPDLLRVLRERCRCRSVMAHADDGSEELCGCECHGVIARAEGREAP